MSWAAKNGHVEVVKSLLGKGADVDLGDYDEQTPLSHAAQEGDVEMVELLLDAGARVGYKDIFGETPLSWADFYGHEEVVKSLLEKIDLRDKEANTALCLARKLADEEVAELLGSVGM